MQNTIKRPILELAEKIKKCEVTPLELTQASLERIEQVDDKVVAWETLDKEGALQLAEELTKEAKNGQIRSILHGIPIGIKDIIDVEGIPTRHNCKAFKDASPAMRDADIVSILKELGAIILGKTHTAELAYFDPSPTKNPYNLKHTPGGSSSGSAAAVAANMIPFSVGTQTNASVARPAAYNGVGGFRPTIQKLSLEGTLSFSKSFDSIGFFGKTFQDASVGVITLNKEFQSFFNEHSKEEILHIGVVRDPLYNEADESVKNVMKKVEQQLREVGHNLEVAIPPCPFSKMIETHQKIMAYEAAQEHKELVGKFETRLGKKFCELIKEGKAISKREYERAVQMMQKTREEMEEFLGKFDLLLAPPANSVAPRDLTITGNPSFTTPWTFVGTPMAVVPVELDKKGLPVGVSFISAPATDMKLIKHCIQLEQHFKRIPDPILN